jgi:hypothetical protein
MVVLGSGLAVLVTDRLAWSPTLLIGASAAAAAAGWGLGAITGGSPTGPPATAAPADG